MPPRKKTTEATAPVFDLSQFVEVKHYVWREIERTDQVPLRVKLQDLSIRQANAIPWAGALTLQTVFEHIAPYVVEWNFEATELASGTMVAIPPPAEVGADVFELLPSPVATSIVLWLRTPWAMKAAAEKKESMQSTNTTDPPKPQS